MEGSKSNTENVDNDLFYLESEHVALRGNKDYSECLKHLFTVLAIREQMIKDYNKVEEMRKHLLENPLETVEKLKSGKDLGIPLILEIPELPKIDFTKYGVNIPHNTLNEIYCSQGNAARDHFSENSEKNKTVSGKVTHKQPWTHEEQKKLEELLNVYPPEPVEANRFRKIAAALGNRTTKQVTSRVQKYFLQLHQKGLAIPGRIPKSCKNNKKATHRHQRHNHYLWKPSSFFPDLCTPVTMDDSKNTAISLPSCGSNGKLIESNYLMPAGGELNNCSGENNVIPRTEKAIKLDLINGIRREKQREIEDPSPPVIHTGYQCDYCSEEPIIGGRWHCIDCKADSVDFCNDCALAQLFSENRHPINHQLVFISTNTKNGICFEESRSESEDSEQEGPPSSFKSSESDSIDE